MASITINVKHYGTQPGPIFKTEMQPLYTETGGLMTEAVLRIDNGVESLTILMSNEQAAKVRDAIIQHLGTHVNP